jgi:hypothetical protein
MQQMQQQQQQRRPQEQQGGGAGHLPVSPVGQWVRQWGGDGGSQGYGSPAMHQPWTSGVPLTPGTEARAGRGGGGLGTDEISLLPESAAVYAARAIMGSAGAGAGAGAEDAGTPRSGGGLYQSNQFDP